MGSDDVHGLEPILVMMGHKPSLCILPTKQIQLATALLLTGTLALSTFVGYYTLFSLWMAPLQAQCPMAQE